MIFANSLKEITQYKAQNITTTYNIARLKEATNQFAEATELYKGILKEHPNYTDCYLRLGCIARAAGLIYEASVWFKESFAVNEKLPEAWCLLGNLHLQKEAWGQAQKTFERLIGENKNDAYANLSLGNIYYSARFEKRDRVCTVTFTLTT
jgi:RNA polymerase-associated protein CTR9